MGLVLIAIALGEDRGKGYVWVPAPQLLDVARGKVDIVLSGPLPQHWALTVVSRGRETAQAKVSAGSVDLDGPFIERVYNLDRQRLDVKPGVVRVYSKTGEIGLAVCMTVPAGTRVRILHDDFPIASFATGAVIQDGVMVGRSPKICASLAVLQQAILGR